MFEAAGLRARLEYRSLSAQGIDREWTATLPGEVPHAEGRLGAATQVGNANRRHRDRGLEG